MSSFNGVAADGVVEAEPRAWISVTGKAASATWYVHESYSPMDSLANRSKTQARTVADGDVVSKSSVIFVTVLLKNGPVDVQEIVLRIGGAAGGAQPVVVVSDPHVLESQIKASVADTALHPKQTRLQSELVVSVLVCAR